MDYHLFKLMLERAYVDTYGKDDKIKKLYEKYLKEKENESNNRNGGTRPTVPSND